MKHKISLILLCLYLFTGAGFAQTIGFQSYILDDDEPLADGQYNITFRIYDQADGGESLWSETQEIQVLQGVINTQLGSVEDLTTLHFGVQYWTSLQLEGQEEMGRLPLSYSPYSFRSLSAEASVIFWNERHEANLTEEEQEVISVTVEGVNDTLFLQCSIEWEGLSSDDWDAFWPSLRFESYMDGEEASTTIDYGIKNNCLGSLSRLLVVGPADEYEIRIIGTSTGGGGGNVQGSMQGLMLTVQKLVAQRDFPMNQR